MNHIGKSCVVHIGSLYFVDAVNNSISNRMVNAKSRGYANNLHNFESYVCGTLTPRTQRKGITTLVKTAYEFYFDCALSF